MGSRIAKEFFFLMQIKISCQGCHGIKGGSETMLPNVTMLVGLDKVSRGHQNMLDSSGKHELSYQIL